MSSLRNAEKTDVMIFQQTRAAKPLSSPPNGAVLRVFARFKPLSLRRCDVRSPVEFAKVVVVKEHEARASFSSLCAEAFVCVAVKVNFFLLCFCDDETILKNIFFYVFSFVLKEGTKKDKKYLDVCSIIT